MIKFKFWFFRNYWWLFLCLVLTIAFITLLYEPLRRIEAIVAIMTILVSTFFFIQKQKLEELKMFMLLFEAFNGRYGSMNDDLNRIRSENKSLKDEDKLKLVDYFNLCGEEYFYYKQRYIPPEVWEAWLNGMNFFYNDQRIQQFWDEELSLNSYYGFKKSLLENRNINS